MGFKVFFNEDGSIKEIWDMGYDKYYSVDELEGLLNGLGDIIEFQKSRMENLEEYIFGEPKFNPFKEKIRG